MNTLIKTVVVFLAMLAVSLTASVTITENTSQRLSFTWEMDEWDTLSLNGSTGFFTSISSRHTNMITGENREPVLPGYAFYAGIPLSGQTSIQCTPIETRSIVLNNPLRTWDVKGTMLRQPGVVFRQPWLSDASVSTMGAIRANYYVVRPFVYNEAAQSVQILTRAQITVTFAANASATGSRRAPSGAYEAMVKGLIMNWDVAQAWTVPATPLAKIKEVQKAMSLTPGKSLYTFKVGDGHGGLNEGTINENGIVRIAGGTLVSLFGKVPVKNIALYGSQKGELPTRIPSVTGLPAGITRIPLIARGFGATIDSSGYFLAYVTGASDWAFDSIDRVFRHRLDRYDDSRTYWVVYDRSATYDTMPVYAGVAAAVDTIRSFENHMLVKQPVKIPTDRWVNNQYEDREGTIDFSWHRFSGSTFNTSFSIADIAPNTSGFLKIDLLSSRSFENDMAGRFGSTSISDSCFLPRVKGGHVLLNPSNTVNLYYTGINDGVMPELVSLTLQWTQPLRLGPSGRMTVYGEGAKGTGVFTLTGVDAPVQILRIPPDESQMSIVFSGDPGATGTVTWTDSTGIGIRYFVVKQNMIVKAPAGSNVVVSSNTSSRISYLRDPGNVADYLLVYAPQFTSEALRLIQHKAKLGRFSAPRMVSIDDVYREFSGGDVDPTALRNFLLYAKHGWTNGKKLDYVLLMGNGNFDYKKITDTESVFIPVFEFGDQSNQMVMEEYFAFHDSLADLSTATVANVFLGRLPCQTSEESRVMVEKIIEMEDPSVADFGNWRNRFLAVADDNKQRENIDNIDHVQSSDNIVQIVLRQWPSIDVRKLYLFDYAANDAYEKPSAELALSGYINNGFGFINWFGHGSEDVWADEHILRPQNLGSLANAKRYPVVCSFSCTVGRFDAPSRDCLNDHLMKLPHAGAIIGIASARLAYADANEELAKVFYDTLFDTVVIHSVGQAYTAAKAVKRNPYLRTYVFLGDPSYLPMALNRRVSLKVTDETGKAIDTLMAMQNVTLEGSVTGLSSGVPDTRFGAATPASVYLGVYNVPDTALHTGAYNNSIKYAIPGRPLFVGQTPVKEGRFSLSFLLPRNVEFDKPGIRITAYAWQGSEVATAADNRKIFHGTKMVEITDTTGPRLSVRPYYGGKETVRDAGAAFSDRITGSLPLNIKIDLYDESGLDVTGMGPDEGLTLEIPGVLKRQNLGSQFQYEQGDFRRGTATLAFEEGRLSSGTYVMNITALDYLGNSGLAKVTLEIVPPKELTLDRVFNYPNPMRMREGTKFYLYTSNANPSGTPADAVDITIRISTLSGKVLRVLKSSVNGQFWDGTDQRGNLLSPNVYLYQVTAKADVGKTVRSQVQKLVILPPR